MLLATRYSLLAVRCHTGGHALLRGAGAVAQQALRRHVRHVVARLPPLRVMHLPAAVPSRLDRRARTAASPKPAPSRGYPSTGSQGATTLDSSRGEQWRPNRGDPFQPTPCSHNPLFQATAVLRGKYSPIPTTSYYSKGLRDVVSRLLVLAPSSPLPPATPTPGSRPGSPPSPFPLPPYFPLPTRACHLYTSRSHSLGGRAQAARYGARDPRLGDCSSQERRYAVDRQVHW